MSCSSPLARNGLPVLSNAGRDGLAVVPSSSSSCSSSSSPSSSSISSSSASSSSSSSLSPPSTADVASSISSTVSVPSSTSSSLECADLLWAPNNWVSRPPNDGSGADVFIKVRLSNPASFRSFCLFDGVPMVQKNKTTPKKKKTNTKNKHNNKQDEGTP